MARPALSRQSQTLAALSLLSPEAQLGHCPRKFTVISVGLPDHCPAPAPPNSVRTAWGPREPRGPSALGPHPPGVRRRRCPPRSPCGLLPASTCPPPAPAVGSQPTPGENSGPERSRVLCASPGTSALKTQKPRTGLFCLTPWRGQARGRRSMPSGAPPPAPSPPHHQHPRWASPLGVQTPPLAFERRVTAPWGGGCPAETGSRSCPLSEPARENDPSTPPLQCV